MNCKEGDLAYIKKAIRTENIGKIVRCKKHLGYFSRGDSVLWNGEAWAAYDTDDQWVIECKSGLKTQYGSSTEALIIDSWLIPIKGDPTELLKETKELNLVE